MATATGLHTFISYKSEHRDKAIKLRDTLRSWGHQTWFDQDDINTGAYFRDEIQQGLETADAVIGIVTEDALKSREVLAEWDYAFSGEPRLLLLRYQSVDLPYWLRGVQYIDCTRNEAEAFKQLREVLTLPSTPDNYQNDSPEYLRRYHRSSTITSYTPDTPKTDNRAKMLSNVYKAWIVGALRANLTKDSIDLELGLQPEAVLTHTEYGDYTLPGSSHAIAQIFEDMHGELLILGEPGSGKTVLLLQLAEQLLGYAQQDVTQPIPAVFNLSSWGKERKSLDEWLVDELKRSYGVPKNIGQQWVDGGNMTLLLDGLDEIAPSLGFMPGIGTEELDASIVRIRSACIDTINAYREKAPHVDIAVCSRVRDYGALSRKLNLNTAILLHPLTEAQIAKYLAADQYIGIRDLIAEENAAHQMAQSPLLLTLMKETYANIPYIGSPFNQLKLKPTNEDNRRDHLLRRFVEQRILKHSSPYYKHDTTKHYLQWLAWQMVRAQKSVFYIEDLQPDWSSRLTLYRTLSRAGAGIILGMVVGFSNGLIGLLVGGLAGAIIGGLLGTLKGGLFGGLAVGLLFCLLSGLSVGLVFGIIVGLSVGLIVALFGEHNNIRFAEKVSYSISDKRLVALVLFGLLGGLIGILNGALIVGLTFGIIIGLVVELETQTNPIMRTTPNAGLQLSLKHGLLGGLGVGLLFGFVGGPVFGLLGGLLGGMFAGLRPVIQHTALRFSLALEGVIPQLRYDRFLDYCAALGLLRKVGGGYIFRHRMLMEYFAEQYENTRAIKQT